MANREDYLKWRAAKEDAPEPPVVAQPTDTPQELYAQHREQRKARAAEMAATYIEMAPEDDELLRGLRNAEEAKAQGIDLPPDVLTDMKSDVVRQIERGSIRNKLKSSSRLSSWVVADPLNAALTRRDAANISGLAATIDSFAKGADRATTGTAMRITEKMAETSLGDMQTAMADRERGLFDIFADADKQNRERMAETGKPGGGDPYSATVGRFLRSRVAGLFDDEKLDEFEGSLVENLDWALRKTGENEARIGRTYGTTAARRRTDEAMAVISDLPTASEQALALGAYALENPGDFTAWLGLTVVESAPVLAAGAAATLATRNPAIGASVAGLTSGAMGEAQAFNTFVAEGGYDLTNPEHRAAMISDPEFRRRTRDRAFAYGATIGMMDAASGRLAGAALAKSVGGDLVLQSIAQSMMGAGGETLALLASDQQLNMVEIIVEGLAEFATAPIEVAGVGGKAFKTRMQVRGDQAFFKALADSAEGSETKKKAPKKYHDLIDTLTKDGPVETLHIDAQAMDELFQSSGVSAADFLSAVGGVDMDTYTAALDAGGTIEISTASYAEKIIGTDFDGMLREYLKTDPASLSAAEAREMEKQAGELMETAKKAVDDIESGRRELEGVLEEARQSLVSQLRTQGQSPQVAENSALAQVAFVAAQSDRMKITPEEFLKRFPLPEVRGAFTPAPVDTISPAIRAALPEADPARVAEAVAADGLGEDATIEEIRASYERYEGALNQDATGETRRLPDLEKASPGPVPGVREVASSYMEARGLPVRHQSTYAKVDVERAKLIAAEYDKMESNPQDPEVRAAYDALVEETIAQYEALLELGFTFNFITGEDPYASPREAIMDMQENKHLWVFPTDSGFGTLNESVDDNPLLAMTDYEIDGRKVRVNDLFRIVHDVFGHGSEGAAFGPRGEENAWQAHVRMFSPLAARAMTSETRGQNSWVNYGPYGDQNRANPADTVFADQKVGLLPEWVSEVGQAEDILNQDRTAFDKWFGDSKVVDGNGEPLVVYHGTDQGGFAEFNVGGRGKTDGTGAFFTDSLYMASTYSGRRDEIVPATVDAALADPETYGVEFEYNEDDGMWTVYTANGYEYYGETKRAALEDAEANDSLSEEQAGNYGVYLSLQDPMVFDAEGRSWDDVGERQWRVENDDGDVEFFYDEAEADAYAAEHGGEVMDDAVDMTTDDLARMARDAGADGVIIKNVFDGGPHSQGGETGTVYVAFGPTQIKSAHNAGTYDAKDPNIMYQGPVVIEDQFTLTHWSDERRDVIDPAKAGTGPLQGAERNRRGPKKTFFGMNVGKRGGYVKERLGSYRHTVKVARADLYDLTSDIDGFASRVPDDVPSMQRMGWIEEQIKDAGFKGYYVTEGPQGMSAALFEPVKPSRVRRDRVAARPFSAVDLLRKPLTFDKKKPKIIDVAEALTARHEDAFGRELTPDTDEADYAAVKKAMTDELRTQLREPNSGVGWYSKDVGDALAMASEIYPTLATSQADRNLFLTFAGIFSNGTTPQQAFQISAEAFEQYLETGEVPVFRSGDRNWSVRNNNNVAQLGFVKYLSDTLGGVEAAMNWLTDTHPRAEIDAVMRDSGMHKKGRFVTKKALDGPDEVGLIAFGEKLGRYTMGLFGFDVDAGDVTIDLWYTRTYRRLVGGLLRGPIGGEGIVSGPTDTDRRVIRRLTGDLAETFASMKMSVGDVQAVLWFFEKRLWGAQGISTDEGTNSDGARQLLKAKGYDPDRATGNGKDQATGDTFYQRDKGPRGSILLPRTAGETPVITLFEHADLSTFLHETGHYFLHTLQQMSQTGEAADWDAIVQWWASNAEGVAKDGGVTTEEVVTYLNEGTTGDAEVDAKINVGLHEQFARAFESYLMEGKAPSNALRSAFEAFSSWLLAAYRRVKGDLNVNVSPEMRDVFDRLLATDEEIAAKSAEYNIDKLVADSAEALNIDPEEYARLVRLGGEAQDEAKQALLLSVMAPIRRQRSQQYREERETVRAEIAARVHAKPANRVREWLGNERWISDDMEENPNPSKLPLDLRMSRQSIIEDFDEETLAALPRGRRPITTAETTLRADDVAGWFGYKSGAEMVSDLITAPAPQKEIDMLVKAEMRKRYGDPLGDGSIEAEAVKALHGDKRGQLIAAELRALNKNGRNGKTTTRSQAQEIARRTIANMPMRKAIRSGQYLAAERRAAERSQQAVVKGDLTGAFEAKRQQLLNHALYMESRAADELLAKVESRVAKLKSKGTRKNLAGEYLAAIDDILLAYDFRKSTTQRREKSLAGLNAYIEMMEESGRGNQLAIPAHVRDAASRKPYRTLTAKELRGVYDSLVNIEHTARMKQKLRDAQSERDKTETIEGMVASAEANVKDANRNRVKTDGEKRKDWAREGLNLLLSADTILRKFDGFERGAFYEAIKGRIDAASSTAITMRREAGEAFEHLYSRWSKRERRAMARKKHHPMLKGSYSKWDLISMALNMGNSANLARLMDKDAKGFNQSQVEYVKQQLDDRDWAFVQESWDYIDTFWPLIVEREKRVSGVTPVKVEASEVHIPGRREPLRGGYYPIVYDGDMSRQVENENFEEVLQNMRGGKFGKAQTANGHLIEREGGSGGRVLQIGMEVMHMHVGKVIHDLAYSEAVVNAHTLLNDPRITALFEKKGLLNDARTLEVWLQDVAVGQISGGGFAGSLALRAKNGFTLSKLAFNLSTVMLQFTGVAQTAVVIGKKNAALGYSDYVREGMNTSAERIMAASPFMAERQSTFHRDINDLMGDLSKGPTSSSFADVQQWTARWGFMAMTKAQFYGVDLPTWLGGYRQGMDKFNDHEKAVLHADRMVARAQASGVFADRSAFERGSTARDTRQNGFIRLFTTLGSYMFAKGNVAYEVLGKARNEATGFDLHTAMVVFNAAVDLTLLFTVEAIFYHLIKGTLPGWGDEDDDDEKGWARFLAEETALSMMSTMPLIRDVGSAMSGFDGGTYASVIDTLFTRPLTQGAQGELDMPLFKALNNAAGAVIGYPSGQLNKTVDAWYRLEQGEDISPVEFLMGVNR